MRKTLILVGMLLISFTLVACGGDVTTVTPPSFNSISVDGMAPVVDGELITFYKGKNETILIEVSINNPDRLLITSIIIDGYNYFSSRFTEASTANTIFFEMSAGTTLGIKTLSLDEITYKDGSTTKTVLVNTNNEFTKYVFKNIPTVERESYSVNQGSISVNFDILDIDEVIATNSLIAELYSGETLVASEILSSGNTLVEFTSLLSNKNYEIKVKANFNLDDDQGYITDFVLYSGPFSTLDNSIPNASIVNPVVTSNSIVFDVLYTDNDSVTQPDGITIGVFKNGVLDPDVPIVHITGSTPGIYIGDLLNNNEYTLKVLSNYDLLDGHSIITDAILSAYTFSTLPRDVPEPIITNLDIEENRILFDLEIIDPDGLIDKDTLVVNLYVDGVIKEHVPFNQYSADFQIYNLFAENSFVIEIRATYDLNDGLGDQVNQIIYSREFTTYENDIPTVDVDDIVITQGYVTVDVEVFDADNTLDGALTAILYEIFYIGDLEQIVEKGRVQFDTEAYEVVFSYLTSYLKGYRVDIIADYNLRDGSLPKKEENLYRSLLLSSERKAPAAELNDSVFGTEQIEVNINIMDSDETIEPGTTFVYLYLNGLVIKTEELFVGANAIVFEDLYSNNEYEIVVETTYNYDLIEETVLLLDQELISSVVFTLEKEVPAAIINPGDVLSSDGEIEFKVEVIDEFNTIDGLNPVLYAVLLLDDVEQFRFDPLTVGNNFGVLFTGLLSDTQYEIKIITEYDLNDGNGFTDPTELTNYFVKTINAASPSSQNFNINATQDEITFDVEILDPDGVIITNPIAKLFIGDVDTLEELPLIVGINSSYTFNTVFSSERYNIRIVADLNYNDGTPEAIQPEALITSGYVNTLTNVMVTAEIIDLVTDKTTITFDVEVIDDDGVIESGLQAVLYDEFGDPAAGDPVEIINVGENLGVQFTGLFSDSTYIVKIETNYDLNEGGGVEPAMLVYSDAITLPLDGPSASITVDSTETLNTRIEFDVFVVDSDVTVTLPTLKAYLYDLSGTLIGTPIDLGVGANNDLFFDDLLFGTEYEIKVITDYNLNNDLSDIEDELLVNENTSTVSIIDIIDIIEDTRLINFSLDINDIFGVLVPVGDITVVEVTLRDESNLLVGDVYFVSEPTDFDLLNLWSEYDYKVIVVATYDIDGLVTDKVFEYDFHTLPVEIPEILIINLDLKDGNDIEFEVQFEDLIVDPDKIIDGFVHGSTAGSLQAVLYIDGAREAVTIPINNDGVYTFVGYDGTDGKDYAIVIEGNVDINEGDGPDAEFALVTKSWIYAIKN